MCHNLFKERSKQDAISAKYYKLKIELFELYKESISQNAKILVALHYGQFFHLNKNEQVESSRVL